MAEEAIIARDVLLAEHVDARLHICHVSTAGSVWRSCAGPSSAPGRPVGPAGSRLRSLPHHLLLTDNWVDGYDPVFKVNPPLRTAEDVAALRAGLVEGVIDAVATDHALHAVQDKEWRVGLRPPGHAGAGNRPVDRGRRAAPAELGRDGIADRMSRVPARIAGLTEHGRDLAVGEPANLTLIDPSARWVVEPTSLASRSLNTPYAGMELPARVGGHLPARPTDSPRWKGNPGDSAHRRHPRARGWPDAFRGEAYGSVGETFGEAVFTTGMTGYQETLTDPSYHRQIAIADRAAHRQHRCQRRGCRVGPGLGRRSYVVREPARVRPTGAPARSLDDRLAAEGVVGIQWRGHPGVDPASARTRRDAGRYLQCGACPRTANCWQRVIGTIPEP